MAGQPRTTERILAGLASRSHGVVTRQELLRAGVTRNEVDHRVGSGLLIVQHRGVYRVGHRAPSVEARYLAAVKACGEGALLGALAGSWLWRLVRGLAPPAEVISLRERRPRGVTVQRRRRIDRRDRTVHRGIPLLTVPASLVALASLLPVDELARAVHEADVRYDITAAHLEAALERHPAARMRRTLLALARGDEPILLSRLERLFLALLAEHRLPLPVTNRPQGANYVDCRWPDHRLTVELDSFRFHRSRHSWEKDRQRERDARSRGDEFRRYTWQDVVELPEPTVAEIRTLLADRARRL
jgi:Transcriptional regulator, AbiEi antitoxin